MNIIYLSPPKSSPLPLPLSAKIAEMETANRTSLDTRPGVLIVGSSNVGKRTLISRLISVDFEDVSDESLSQVLVHGWTINTKYYTADVSLWMAHLHEGFSVRTLPVLEALVMVFDLNDLSTLDALKDWAAGIDLKQFEILLCIGNKVDLLPGHPVHAEYRRRLLNPAGTLADSCSDFTEYGISETEGSSLLGDEEPTWESRRSCLEWCTEHNIEYIEACASNTDFDKCLSVNGDSQGVERLFGALSAHMWPGMVLKSGDKITEPSLPEKEVSSEEESDYEFEYEVLTGASAEPWDDSDEVWVSADGNAGIPGTGESSAQDISEHDRANVTGSYDAELQPSTSKDALAGEIDNKLVQHEEPSKASELDMASPFDFDDLEQLMSEIGSMRNNLRLMPDFQRREMAAKLAMKMAAMFGGSSDDEEGFD